MPGRFLTHGKGSKNLIPSLKALKNEKAAILLTTIIVFAFFSTIGLSLIALLYSHITSIQLEIDRLKAGYLAEAGIAQSLYEIRVGIDQDSDGIGNIKPRRLNSGEFWVEHDIHASVIIATGEANGVRRTMQIRYSSL